MAAKERRTYTISISKPHTVKRIAGRTPSELDICLATVFSMPGGKIRGKLTSIPTNEIRRSFDIGRMYEEEKIGGQW